MMPSLTISESSKTPMALTAAQCDELNRAGRRLASTATQLDVDGSEIEASLIDCQRNPQGTYDVTVRDAVGVIGITGLTIVVQPKIPMDHFFHLLEASTLVPRFDAVDALADPDESLWELVATWFIDAAEQLLRRGLIKDYREVHDVLPVVRGSIQPMRTARLFYSGRVEVDCRFEEFDNDNPLNRTIREAARSVSSSPLLKKQLRRRATVLTRMLDDVGPLQRGDLSVTPDRRAAYYRAPVAWAKWVLEGQGLAPRTGTRTAWTFLIRTPDLIETGLRNILADGLAPDWKLARKPPPKPMAGTTMTLNPDLVFESGLVTGDVKYKLPTQWSRADLFQAVVFAAGHRTGHAAVVHFQQSCGVGSHLPTVGVGDITVTPFAWEVGDGFTPTFAGAELVSRVRSWLDAAVPKSGVQAA